MTFHLGLGDQQAPASPWDAFVQFFNPSVPTSTLAGNYQSSLSSIAPCALGPANMVPGAACYDPTRSSLLPAWWPNSVEKACLEAQCSASKSQQINAGGATIQYQGPPPGAPQLSATNAADCVNQGGAWNGNLCVPVSVNDPSGTVVTLDQGQLSNQQILAAAAAAASDSAQCQTGTTWNATTETCDPPSDMSWILYLGIGAVVILFFAGKR